MVTVSSIQKNQFKSFVTHHPLAAMYIGTFILAWAYFVPKALYSWGLFPFEVPDALGLLAGWTPAIAAAVVTGVMGGWEGVKQLFRGKLTRKETQTWNSYPTFSHGPGRAITTC